MSPSNRAHAFVSNFERSVSQLLQDFRTEFEIGRDMSLGALLSIHRVDVIRIKRTGDNQLLPRLERAMSELTASLSPRPAQVAERIRNELEYFVDKLQGEAEWLPEIEPEEFDDVRDSRSSVQELLKEARSRGIDTRMYDERVAEFDEKLRRHVGDLVDTTCRPPEEVANYPSTYWWWHLEGALESTGRRDD